jgi:hypothetical protein
MSIIESTGQKRKLSSAVFLAAFLLSSLALPEMCANHGLALPLVVTNIYALLLDLTEKSAAVLAAIGWVHPGAMAIANKMNGGK